MARGTEQTLQQTYVFEECCACGVAVAMTKLQMAQFRETGASFYCVLGHGNCYRKTEAQRLKENLKEAQDRVAELDTQNRNLTKELEATAKKARRTRQRADKGVCQHCRRSFANVARHVENKHPEALHA